MMCSDADVISKFRRFPVNKPLFFTIGLHTTRDLCFPVTESINVYNQYTQYCTRPHVNIIISNSSGKPIYEQITAQIKRMILSGELEDGAALPSMRLLAKELHISEITTKRA